MQSVVSKFLQQIESVVLGKPHECRLALTCLLAQGHLLIEDLPGMGKTTLAHTLADTLNLSYQRTQFTSDLLPADIVGISIFNTSTHSFELHKGPVFNQVVLADEINRASPKTQSALLEHKDHLIAIDLAGDEYNFPGALFVEHFKKARDAGLQVTVHAGEAGGAKSVWQAINELGATRIGHGVATIEDEKLMSYMVNHNIAIESCLTSNFQTGTVTDLTKHPLKAFLDFGIKACLNTDDPAVQGIEIKNEYQVAQQVLTLSDGEISQLQKNALEVCFLSDTDKKALVARVQ